MSGWSVGQEVIILIPQYRREPSRHTATIKKVGRKWVDTGYWRFGVADGRLDIGRSGRTGYAYRDEAHLAEETARAELWGRLRRTVGDRFEPPQNVSRQSIETALELVGGAVS